MKKNEVTLRRRWHHFTGQLTAECVFFSLGDGASQTTCRETERRDRAVLRGRRGLRWAPRSRDGETRSQAAWLGCETISTFLFPPAFFLRNSAQSNHKKRGGGKKINQGPDPVLPLRICSWVRSSVKQTRKAAGRSPKPAGLSEPWALRDPLTLPCRGAASDPSQGNPQGCPEQPPGARRHGREPVGLQRVSSGSAPLSKRFGLRLAAAGTPVGFPMEDVSQTEATGDPRQLMSAIAAWRRWLPGERSPPPALRGFLLAK